MRHEVVVTGVGFTRAKPALRAGGLIGWVNLDVGDLLQLPRVAVRRTRDGRIVLSYREHLDRRGRRRIYVRPLNDRARLEIEAQVIAELRRQGVLS